MLFLFISFSGHFSPNSKLVPLLYFLPNVAPLFKRQVSQSLTSTAPIISSFIIHHPISLFFFSSSLPRTITIIFISSCCCRSCCYLQAVITAVITICIIITSSSLPSCCPVIFIDVAVVDIGVVTAVTFFFFPVSDCLPSSSASSVPVVLCECLPGVNQSTKRAR